MFRVILILTVLIINKEDLIINFNIFTSVIYTEAMRDSI